MSALVANLVVLVHLGFVAFVVLGGLLALKWPRAMWFHLPALGWGAWVEFTGTVCPLTPLEQWLRERAGEAAYSGGFIEHYILPLLYPEEWSRSLGLVLGTGVIVLNIVVYVWVWRHRRRKARWPEGSGLR